MSEKPAAGRERSEAGEAKPELCAPKVEKTTALARLIDALCEATAALLRKLETTAPSAPPKTPAPAKEVTMRKRESPSQKGGTPGHSGLRLG